jgi:hypothetical protein
MEIANRWFYPAAAPVAMPAGLIHLDSHSCWREPIIEADEIGEEIVIHRQVTWN